jgi:hypothetical protein
LRRLAEGGRIAGSDPFGTISTGDFTWMEADFGCNRWRANDILTHVARLSIGHYTPGTVAAKIERRYLERPS